MPKMSGKETLEQLKTYSNFNTPVVVLTANAVYGVKDEYITLGFNDYLSKPIEKDELNRVLKKYLDK
jgi:CheY-like chemotaxis protein